MSGSERVVRVDLPGGWVAMLEWPEGVTSGGPASVVVEPADPDRCPHGGLSQTVLRAIDFRDAAEQLRTQLAGAETDSAEDDESIRAALADGVSDEYLARLSVRYVAVTGAGQSKPLQVLAEITGKTPSTVKGHLWTARKRGFLLGSQGRAGGVVTPEARRILGQV